MITTTQLTAMREQIAAGNWTCIDVLALLDEIERMKGIMAEAVKEDLDRDPWAKFQKDAPGHGHNITGVWDSDNGKYAGKKCALCALWAECKKAANDHMGSQ